MRLKLIAFMALHCINHQINCNEIKPAEIGNFAVRKSFQPGPLFAKGQKMADRHQVLFYEIDVFTWGKHRRKSWVLTHDILYGISDRCTMLISPSNARYQDTENGKKICSTGLLDLPVTFEYFYYIRPTEHSMSKLSLVGTIFFPTGPKFKNPPLGFGSPSFFCGLTGRYLSTDWYLFADVIAWPKTKRHGTKYGDAVMYDWGIGYNLKHVPNWVFLLLWESNGFFSNRDVICGKIQPNTGGNTIFSGPSLWISNNNLKIQSGVQWPIYQHLFGNQHKRTFRFGLYITIGFN